MEASRFEKKCRALIPLLLLAGCGPVEVEEAPPPPRQQAQAQEDLNGLSFNGLSFNGLSFNGLSFNGLSFNGLSTSAFDTWFESNPATAALVMRYVVRCAVPGGQTRAYVEPSTGQQYAWSGGLGLAPGWASGQTATLAEQQAVSACLGAHANRMSEEVSISVLGRDAGGTVIPFTSQELTSHPRRESCFFGNLFSGQGLFVGGDREPLGPAESTSRACGPLLNGGSESTVPCAPLVYVGACATYCTLDASGLYYTSCTYNGTTYQRPITTRLRVEDVHVCGDTVCQNTERCGTSTRYDSCALDCGPCP